MELHAMTDDINDLFFFFSTFYMTYFFFFTFYINHNLPFMNDDEGFVPLFTRVSVVTSLLAAFGRQQRCYYLKP